MSESNRVSLKYVPETSYGVTPVNSPDWQALRYTSESVGATPNTVTSAEIRADRMTSDMPKVSVNVDGSIDFEMSAITYDDFFEAVMCSNWEVDGSTETLEIGTLDKSFSIEKEFEDIGRFIQVAGVRVGEMSLNLSYGNIMTGTFSFMGNGYSAGSNSLVGTGTVANATTTDVLNATSDVGTVSINGTPTNMFINSLSISVNNNQRPIESIGRETPADILKGTAAVSGTAEIYLSGDSFAMYVDALENNDTSFEYTVEDGDYSYTFVIPRAKVEVPAPSSGGLDQDVMISVTFNGLLDPVTETSFRIIKETL